MTCGDCGYWLEIVAPRPIEQERIGACRRYPPVVLRDTEREQHTTTPIVAESGWCGEWRLR